MTRRPPREKPPSAKTAAPPAGASARGKRARAATKPRAVPRSGADTPPARGTPAVAQPAQFTGSSADTGRTIGPALGLLELSSVARGMVVADAMAKRATIELLQARSTTPGKFVVLVAGGEEEVAQAMAAGLELSAGTLIDRLYLALVDPQILPAIPGAVQVNTLDAVAIIETFSVAAAVLAADRAVKAAQVSLVQLRLARGLGGKAFFILTGELHQLQAAVEAGGSIVHDGMLLTTEIIARPHPDLIRSILTGS